MEDPEVSFLEFIRTGKFGNCSKDTRQAELIDLLPDIWISGTDYVPPYPYTLMGYESLEFVFEHEDFDRFRIRWGDGSDITYWTSVFDVTWYDFIKEFDAEMMHSFLKKHAIAHSCYYFDDESVAIEITQISIMLCFAGTIEKLFRFYRDFLSWRGSPIPDKSIDFIP